MHFKFLSLTIITGFMLTSTIFTHTASAQILSEEWKLEIGAGGLFRPEYPGSDSYDVLPLPYIDVKYGDDEWFSFSGQSLKITAYTYENFKTGIIGKLDFGRDEDDDSILKGLGDVDFSFEIGIFADYKLREYLLLQASVRRGLGGHESFIGDAGIFFQNKVDKFSYRIGPNITIAESQYLDEYYGISAAQSARSGHPIYNPSGGLVDIGLTLQTKYQINEKWSIIGYTAVDFLLEEVTDSPLAEEDFAPYVGLFFSYKVR